MKKTNLLFAFLLTLLTLVSCTKNHIEPSRGDSDQSADCSVQTSVAHLLLAGTPQFPKKWSAQYTDTTGARISVPGLISPSINNTLYFQPNDSLKEYSYLGNLMDSGTWSLSTCGKTIILNTNLSGANLPFVLTELTPIYFQGYFFIPVGANGSIVKVIFKGNLIQ